jgi:hypothetical protein
VLDSVDVELQFSPRDNIEPGECFLHVGKTLTASVGSVSGSGDRRQRDRREGRRKVYKTLDELA